MFPIKRESVGFSKLVPTCLPFKAPGLQFPAWALQPLHGGRAPGLKYLPGKQKRPGLNHRVAKVKSCVDCIVQFPIKTKLSCLFLNGHPYCRKVLEPCTYWGGVRGTQRSMNSGERGVGRHGMFSCAPTHFSLSSSVQIAKSMRKNRNNFIRNNAGKAESLFGKPNEMNVTSLALTLWPWMFSPGYHLALDGARRVGRKFRLNGARPAGPGETGSQTPTPGQTARPVQQRPMAMSC